ncbi:MAG: ABC transporter ATP-binding protein [Candidatus Berkelbacteria bacterium]|nr:ABC transporter ATP-binding protein [Candidatus Berkelbacteria bacterium]
MLKVMNLSKKFQSGEHLVIAVNNVNFVVPDGVFAAIVGKSGSGKTSLLSLLGALDKPSNGEIFVGGENVSRMSDLHQIKYRRDKIGFVFQGYNLVPNLSAIKNVMLPLEFAGVGKLERQNRAQELLKKVGIDEIKSRRLPARLSGGEQQRVAIARALANKPDLVLADEPTGNLDSATGKIIIKLLKDLAKKEKTTIIAVTHDTAIADDADLRFTMKDGKLT